MKKKPVMDGDVIVYKDQETNEICATIITYVTGRHRHQYYRVGMNGLGMIMDYIDPQLQIQGLNRCLKASFSSLDEIMACKKPEIKAEAAYMLFYYVQNANERDDRLYPLLERKGFRKEDIAAFFRKSSAEDQAFLVDNSIMNILSPDEVLEFLKNIEDADLLHKFIMNKADRGYFFNTNRNLIEDKINTLITDEESKQRCLVRLASLSWDLLTEKNEYIAYVCDNFENLAKKDKEMFLYRLNTTLVNIKRSDAEDKEAQLEKIVNSLTECKGFVDFVSENIGEYFNTLSGNADYDLGYYFDLLTFVNLNNFRTDLLAKVKVSELLKSDAISAEIIDYIFDNHLYVGSYEDGSVATENNLSAIARHKNTSSRVLETIVKKDETYLSADSYGKWDVVAALANPNIDKHFLREVLGDTTDEATIFGCLENPNCPKDLYNKYKSMYKEGFVYSTTGYNMVHKFD